MSTTSIAQCPRFVQNAWKKDLCSNCFKSKEEHAVVLQTVKSIPTSPQKIPPPPAKSIIKVNFPTTSSSHNKKSSSKKKSVNFPKEVSEVIGFGGEWSGSDGSDYDDDVTDNNDPGKEVVYDEDENLQRLTKTNTEFNMNNGNLLGDPTSNIKRSFAALKLGAPQKDSAGKKQTLKISVTPFNTGPTSTKFDIKSKLPTNESKDEKSKSNNGIILKSITSTSNEGSCSKTNGNDEVDKSPDYEVKISNEKSLLEEISETLLSKRIVVNEKKGKEREIVESKSSEQSKNDVIKVEIKNQESVTSAIISSDSTLTTTSSTISAGKRSITRGNAILKDMEKPKIQIFSKTSESDNGSDMENGTTSDYYDVVETRNSYENIPDGIDNNNKKISISVDGPDPKKTENEAMKTSETLLKKKSHFFSNQTVSEMFLAHKPINDAIKKRSESYNLADKTFVTSKITNDGLIVTKSHINEDALDSTGSSFDSSSSDEELSNNRSESDSGINVKSATTSGGNVKNGSSSNHSSDYEDIQVADEIQKAMEKGKSRALAGEPDGRSDPDGSSETSPAPALPQNPPPSVDPRQSFLHSSSATNNKFTTPDKPKVPTKPVTVNIVKPFQKRNAEIIMQLQQVINKEKSLSADSLDVMKSPKKTRAPVPPNGESEILKTYKEEPYGDDEPIMSFKEIAQVKNKMQVKTNTVQLKEARSYPAINPKFRSLNHLNKSHDAQEKLEKFEKLQKPSTPEPAPRHSLSLSQDSLNADMEKSKKKKFSIKKFLRMGNNKTENGSKKDYSHYADIPTSPTSDGDGQGGVPQVKPRLIIIHPLDINNTGVQVVKDASSASPTSSPECDKTQIVVHKPPPAPPVRADTTKLEVNKPSRPPPPKNTELRSKIESEVEQQGQSQKSKAPSPPIDNVYANLGEVRNSIAPRKPERTASMREREAKALELQRRQPVGSSSQIDIDDDSASIDETCKSEESIIAKPILVNIIADSFSDRKKKLLEIENISTRSKIEMFESNAVKTESSKVLASKSPPVSPVGGKQQTTTYYLNNDNLKSSVQKMNVTIDNYLKNKKLISVSDTNLLNNSRSPTPPQILSSASQEMAPLTHNNNNRNYSIRNSGTNVSNIDFCGSEAGFDVAQGDPIDGYQASSRSNKTVSRLRMRKGRSVVHTNLEDNYSAVIVANHEALAQVLDQLQQPHMIPPTMRPIANSINLRFDDFIIIDSIGLVVGKSVFHQAVWQNSIYVTLVLTSDSNQMVSGVCSELNQMSGGASGALKMITEFCDLVPNNYLPSMPTTKVQMVQATITVLPKLNVETLEAMGAMIKSKAQNQSLFNGSNINLNSNNSNLDDDTISMNEKSPSSDIKLNKNGLFDDLLCREVSFIMLQLVNGLKMLQAKGVEEMPLGLSNIIMCRELDKETQARLCILQGLNPDISSDEDEEMGTLCQCALKVLKEFLPETKLTPILSHLLEQERADTLSKSKSVLEYLLWGPADVPINGPLREREVTLQRWLDLSRATALRSLAGSKIDLTIYDECHLIFLIRSNSKAMFDASQIIAANFNAPAN
ncbi:CLUMA_CG004567, isoform A [Clunio marinus]|uniref:CLUMA_CG004567, isoform A n=1 Tax=Clunio marinus TaxID=568069 RepID=A0A1J1HS81_9DIPT|nr:CLUMA_CG004567, isoform A [Clunio marinus]